VRAGALGRCGFGMPPSARKAFVDTLRRLASDNGLEFLALSKDWIIQISDPQTGRLCSIFGYTFDVNPAAAVEICTEKAATSLVLDKHKVANINHSVFLNPAHEMTAEYLPRSGCWAEIQKLVGELGFPVVLKPLKGTGGLDVIKATCWREVEAAVQHIFSHEYGLAVSPYKRIVDEYRCFCLDEKVELIYRKIRSTVVGDGSRSVSALLAGLLADPAADGKALSALAKAAAALSPEELTRVPAVGECVPVQWKHNLGQGATASFDVRPELREQLMALAPRAASAIGMRFCSVDVVEVEQEGLLVMEVNSGVMMDSLIAQLGDEGAALATRLYGAAVLKALGRTT